MKTKFEVQSGSRVAGPKYDSTQLVEDLSLDTLTRAFVREFPGNFLQEQAIADVLFSL